MAGAGYKLFNTGDVLTAAQVNTYLMQQTVMVFASATARTTALSGVLAEGMVSYLQDTNALEVYDGSAWVASAAGDITAVTAGTGISGGGTSGAVTITNSMATEITAAGDIIVGTGSGTFDNLPIGTTGQVLTADTTVSPYKVKWASAAGGGKVLQVVSTTKSDTFTTTSSTWTDVTGLSATITPAATSSKILVLVDVNANSDPSTHDGQVRLVRGSTAIKIGDADGSHVQVTFAKQSQNYYNDLCQQSGSYLDSPSTTSATTYKVQVQRSGGTGSDIVAVNRTEEDGSTRARSTSTITVMEIGA